MQLLVHFYGVLILVVLAQPGNLKPMLRSNMFKVLMALWIYVITVDTIGVLGQIGKSSPVYMYACFVISFFVPLSYLFMRRHYQRTPFSSMDVIHVLPFIVCLAGLILFSNPYSAATITYRTLYLVSGYAIGIAYIPFLVVARRAMVKEPAAMPKKMSVAYKNIPMETTSQQMSLPVTPWNSKKQQLPLPTKTSFQVNDVETKEMKALVKSVMSTAPYLKRRYAITDMAKESNLTVHQLSAFINNYYKMNFTDFINAYRVEYFKRKVMEDETWRSYTLEAIARKSGFGTRATFNTAFQKFNGITPAQFMRLPYEDIGGEDLDDYDRSTA